MSSKPGMALCKLLMMKRWPILSHQLLEAFPCCFRWANWSDEKAFSAAEGMVLCLPTTSHLLVMPRCLWQADKAALFLKEVGSKHLVAVAENSPGRQYYIVISVTELFLFSPAVQVSGESWMFNSHFNQSSDEAMDVIDDIGQYHFSWWDPISYFWKDQHYLWISHRPVWMAQSNQKQITPGSLSAEYWTLQNVLHSWGFWASYRQQTPGY